MGDLKLAPAESKFDVPETKRGIYIEAHRLPDVDLTNAGDSNIAKNVMKSQASGLADFEITGTDKSQDAGEKPSRAGYEERFNARGALNDSISKAVDGDEQKVLAFNHWMNKFESKLGRDNLTRIGNGAPESVNTDAMNKSIASVYSDLNKVLIDGQNSPLNDAQRLVLVRDFMKEIGNENPNYKFIDAGKMKPERAARFLREMTTEGALTDIFGNKYPVDDADVLKRFERQINK